MVKRKREKEKGKEIPNVNVTPGRQASMKICVWRHEPTFPANLSFFIPHSVLVSPFSSIQFLLYPRGGFAYAPESSRDVSTDLWVRIIFSLTSAGLRVRFRTPLTRPTTPSPPPTTFPLLIIHIRLFVNFANMADSKAHDAIAPVDERPSDSVNTVIQSAKAATDKERKMSLLQGIKLYPKAVAWSVLISTCIVMEGYDISLVNNFYAFDPFKKKYGTQLADGSYQVPAKVCSQ